MKTYKTKYNVDPDDYAVTAYDAATVILAAIKQITDAGKEPTRDAVRDAIQAVKVKHAAGPGRVRRQWRSAGQDDQRFPDQAEQGHPAPRIWRNYHYIGVAPSA